MVMNQNAGKIGFVTFSRVSVLRVRAQAQSEFKDDKTDTWIQIRKKKT